MALRNYLVGEVAEDFADGLLTRREALRRLGLLGLGVTSAGALLAACG
ncbi:MAG: carboxymethylenebutenolidase, partial [Pseudonocardiales bacterium]|nr:carboxymethylenebutenolidase [Pseudonocardiales bacterium]